MAVEVYIDGDLASDVGGSVTPRLNAPSQGQVRVPMHLATGDVGSRVKFMIDDVNALHGRCTYWELSADENTGYVTYNVTDPMEMWDKRPARDADGDFSNPSFIEDYVTAPQIMEQILTNSADAGDVPDDAEGPLEVQLGDFATGGVSVVGAPTDWPMTIAEIASLLISTGQLDIVALPIDSAGDMARINCFNGNYGTDRSAEVLLQYGFGNYNVKSLRWTKDLQNVANKIWYYLGPRVKTEHDPGSVQHWRASVTTATDLPDPPKSAVVARRLQSQADYGVRMEIQIYDAQGDEATVAKHLYHRLWLAESWLRARPRDLYHVEPVRGSLTFGDFGVGDLISVAATAAVSGGFSGVQRIYEYTASWDADSVLTIGELQTSPTNEGFS